MVVHADYLAFGTPTPLDIRSNFISLSLSVLVENISIICVNVFVLISGWFGIHPKFKSIGGFWFQCIFFYFLVYFVLIILGCAHFALKDFIYCSTIHGFAARYTIMYIFTPIVNAWLHNCSEKKVRLFLFVFYGFSFLLGWPGIIDEFNGGNSVLSFIGLYILARYCRLYGNLKYWSFNKLFCAYLTILILETTLVVIPCLFPAFDRYSNVLINISTAYIAPNVVIKSLLLLLVFNKIKLRNRAINFVAASSFASVLLHGNRFVFNLYLGLFPVMFVKYQVILFLAISFGIMITILVVAVIIDQVRLLLWNSLYRRFEKKLCKTTHYNDNNCSSNL